MIVGSPHTMTLESVLRRMERAHQRRLEREEFQRKCAESFEKLLEELPDDEIVRPNPFAQKFTRPT